MPLAPPWVQQSSGVGPWVGQSSGVGPWVGWSSGVGPWGGAALGCGPLGGGVTLMCVCRVTGGMVDRGYNSMMLEDAAALIGPGGGAALGCGPLGGAVLGCEPLGGGGALMCVCRVTGGMVDRGYNSMTLEDASRLSALIGSKDSVDSKDSAAPPPPPPSSIFKEDGRPITRERTSGEGGLGGWMEGGGWRGGGWKGRAMQDIQ